MPLLLHFFFGVDYCFTFGRLNNRIGEGTHEACPYYTFRGVGGLFREVDAYPGCTQYQQRALSHDEAVNMAAMGNLQPVRLHCDLSDFEHCKAIDCLWCLSLSSTRNNHSTSSSMYEKYKEAICRSVAASDVSVE